MAEEINQQIDNFDKELEKTKKERLSIKIDQAKVNNV
jgi:hypothetical protein